MNSESILQEINNISNSIDKLTWIFYRKLKQPSIHSIEDLQNEAVETVIRVLQSGCYNPKKETKLSTYLIRSIKSRFYDIVWKSFKEVNTINLDTTFAKTGRFSSKSDKEIFEIFSEEEIKYITTFLFPPEEIKEECLNLPRGRMRNIVRKHLNLLWKQENYIRKSIEEKLTNLMKGR